jgi:hypothetical protein
MSNFNTDNFKSWKKDNVKEGELSNYVAYQDKNRNRVVIFNSGDDLVQHFEQNFFGEKPTWTPNGTRIATKKDEKDEWRFGNDYKNYENTKKALSDGSILGNYLSTIEEAKQNLLERFPELSELNEIAISKRRRRKFTEDGDELDIDRYMSGDPAMFASMPRQQVRKRSARIYIDICVSGGNDAIEVTRNVAAALAMCDIVENAGISTEIVIGATSKGAAYDTNYFAVAAIAKQSDEPLDIARMISFCLPGMFRQFIFGAWANVTNKSANSGLGQVLDNLKQCPELYNFWNCDVSIQASNNYMNENNIRLIIKELKTLFNINEVAEI